MQPTTSSGSRLRTRAVGISERIDAKHATLAEADGFRARNHGASARAHIAGDSSGRVGDRNARHRSEPEFWGTRSSLDERLVVLDDWKGVIDQEQVARGLFDASTKGERPKAGHRRDDRLRLRRTLARSARR
jgi:hypothetical protein